MTYGAATAIALCALALAGCGSGDDEGDPIPTRDGNRMVALLELAERQSDAGTCNGALAKVREARGIADGLPDGVDPEVRRELLDGLDRLAELVDNGCSQVEEEPTDTVTTPEPTTTTPEPTTTTPEPTTTTPEPTTTTPEPTTTTPEPTTPAPSPGDGTGGTPPGQSG